MNVKDTQPKATALERQSFTSASIADNVDADAELKQRNIDNFMNYLIKACRPRSGFIEKVPAQPIEINQKIMTDTPPKALNPAQQSLSAIMSNIIDRADSERKQSQPYQELFKASGTFTGLLSKVELDGTNAAMSAFDVYVEKLGGNTMNVEAFEFLLVLPYLSYKLEKHIVETEGSSCSVDKTLFLLSEELKRIAENFHA